MAGRTSAPQRAYTYLIDGETEGGHLTFGSWISSHGRLLPCSNTAKRAASACFYSIRPDSSSLPPSSVALYAGASLFRCRHPITLSRAGHFLGCAQSIDDARPSLALTISSIVEDGSLLSLAPEFEKIGWLATDSDTRVRAARLARP